MSISISNLSELISYDKVVSITVASIVLLLIWFKRSGSNNKDYKCPCCERDEKLFKQPPSQYGDCPICFIRLPTLTTGSQYNSCCGKVICCGCVHAPVYGDQGNIVDKKCPFCRTPLPSSYEEAMKRLKKRVEANDGQAMHSMGCYQAAGKHGFPRDRPKALELFHQAAELGHSRAHCSIAISYNLGTGVEVDKEKAKHYFEQAAMTGDAMARYHLGFEEMEAGNIERALKHFMNAAEGGNTESLKMIKDLYKYELATKEEYTKALQLYQAYLGEIKSRQRDKAAAADEKYRYY